MVMLGVSIMAKVRCLECDRDLNIPDDAVDGEIITCPDCGANYEVMHTSKGIELKQAESVGEDWGE